MPVSHPQAVAEAGISGRIPFDNTYAALPERFFQRVEPTPVAAPRLIALNDALAEALGLDPEFLKSPEGVAILAGNRIAEGSAPLAQAYAGHQFGNFVPQLGDGRAVLLGEVLAPSGERFDIQLKGSGPTRFSRRGDGRAALGPVIREYIVSEAMAALGLPTTRSLAAVTSGEQVVRERMLPGGVLTRVASSHLRVGTFEYFAAREDIEGLRLLADYAISRHYPDAAEAADPYLALFEGVAARLADLVARWMQIGFIHGVLNTDNTSIAGETIDYGPCAFMDAYHPRKVFSSIDRQGRYAYQNQPGIMKWNLARLGECLLPLFSGERDAALAKANDVLGTFGTGYKAAYLAGFRRKLGLFDAHADDEALIGDLLARMAEGGADFTLTFRALSELAGGTATDDSVRDLFSDKASYDAWAFVWRERLSREPRTPQERSAAMKAVNPKYIPRNHRVEAAIAAAELGQCDLFDELNRVLARPYDDQPAFDRYCAPPQPEEEVTQTFCGT
ncbi:protein adenylyltransferase SelO [Pseudorhodoplanes sp.]|uniref:protein adenylyltransferase SelO n=1 Tax=Pseudorhodoplanes sp. TaxID=1934341 RepID=UPI00391A02BF